MDVSLDNDILKQLFTKEAISLHSVSDGLRACNTGISVYVPQIIVVGEQSAGKSSVLEAISHIRFPVDEDICTRFATELILNHADEIRIDASVRFADKTKPAKTFERTKFHQDDLPGIIKEAKEHMGISEDGKDFSQDVLRLEIKGPNIYPLTLVDLPALYDKSADDKSPNGREAADKLVESYMWQKNSIILLVVSADTDLSQNAALRKAMAIDPKGQRTIGVITKPDLAFTADDKLYILLAKNRERIYKLQLGWHVLRNRGEDKKSLETRDEVEKSFFEKNAWGTIPKEHVGIESLRTKLRGILYNHIRNDLAGVIAVMEAELKQRQEEVARLGTARPTVKEWRSYMLTISSDFQRLARDGCNGRYNDPFFGSLEDEVLKFRAVLRNLNRVFDHILRTRGSTESIVVAGEEESQGNDLPDYLARFLEIYPYEFPEPEKITIEQLSINLESKAAANQGREFPGSQNADLAMQLFKSQAAPWKRIAEFHVETVMSVARTFVDHLVQRIVGSPQNDSNTEAILTTIVDPWFEEKEELLQEKIDELLWPYLTGYSLPVDIDFYRASSQESTKRATNQICKTLQGYHPDLFKETFAMTKCTPETVNKAISLHQSSREGEFGTGKTIDMMLTYYDMSRRTFTDNVINLAISFYDILTPTEVNNLNEDQLEELASERPEMASRRTLLNEEIRILQDGLKKYRKYRPRTVAALPPSRPLTKSLAAPATSKTGTDVAVNSRLAIMGSSSPVPAAGNVKAFEFSLAAPVGVVKRRASSSASGDAVPSNEGVRVPGGIVTKPEPQQNSASSTPGTAASLVGGQASVQSTPAIVNFGSATQPQQNLASIFGSKPPTVAPQQQQQQQQPPRAAPQQQQQQQQPPRAAPQQQQQQQTKPVVGTGTGTNGFAGSPSFNISGGGPGKTNNLPATNTLPSPETTPKQQLPSWTEEQTRDLACGHPYVDIADFEGECKFIGRMLHICHLENYQNFSSEELRFSETIRRLVMFGPTQPSEST
ncbi:hypothetical protein FPOA_00193 [Fusarium poae]|uniref:GED domain-containing protein n=1 Tax=Fusarium poae TaxID=36050 RepID=A0A1B8B0K0_FUSPO|nr:hypothetical protein FPOA_00193 [Fusarium poae]